MADSETLKTNNRSPSVKTTYKQKLLPNTASSSTGTV